MQEQPYERSVFDHDVSPFSGRHLPIAIKWAKFLGVLGFVLSSIWVLILLTSFVKSKGRYSWTNSAESMGKLTGLLLIAGVYYYLSYALYRFSSKAQQAAQTNNPGLYNESFRYLKRFFKGLGITMIVFVSIYFLGFVIDLLKLA